MMLPTGRPTRTLTALVDVLLTLGADPNARTPDGDAALHLVAWAAPAEWKLHVSQQLLAHGADITILDTRHRTAADICREVGDHQLAALLEGSEP